MCHRCWLGEVREQGKGALHTHRQGPEGVRSGLVGPRKSLEELQVCQAAGGAGMS